MVACKLRSVKELILITLTYPDLMQLVIFIATVYFLPSISSVLKELVREILIIILGG